MSLAYLSFEKSQPKRPHIARMVFYFELLKGENLFEMYESYISEELIYAQKQNIDSHLNTQKPEHRHTVLCSIFWIFEVRTELRYLSRGVAGGTKSDIYAKERNRNPASGCRHFGVLEVEKQTWDASISNLYGDSRRYLRYSSKQMKVVLESSYILRSRDDKHRLFVLLFEQQRPEDEH